MTEEQQQTNPQLPGTSSAEKIESLLRKFGFNNGEIARILLELDKALQEDIGQELIENLPKNKQDKFISLVENNRPLSEIQGFFNISSEQMRQKIESKLRKIAESLEKELVELDIAEEQTKREIARKLLAKQLPIS